MMDQNAIVSTLEVLERYDRLITQPLTHLQAALRAAHQLGYDAARLQRERDALLSELQSLRTEKATLGPEVEQLRTEKATLEPAVAALQTAKAGLTPEVAALRTERDSARADCERWNAELTRLRRLVEGVTVRSAR